MEKGNRVFMKQYFNSVLKGYPFGGKYDQDFFTLKNCATFFFLRVALVSVKLPPRVRAIILFKKQTKKKMEEENKNQVGKVAGESQR